MGTANFLTAAIEAASKPSLFILSDCEERYLLSSPMVGMSLLVGTCIAYCVINGAVVYFTPTVSHFGELERQACFVAAVMQLAAIMLELFTRQRLSKKTAWTQKAVFLVKLLSTLTNLALYQFPTPMVVDPVSLRPNSMLRWAEWTVLAFTMTFVVESIDSTSLYTPLTTATSQSVSTICGLFLPYCAPGFWWHFNCWLSFILYFYIFWRLYVKELQLRDYRRQLPSRSYALRKAELGLGLLRQCVCTWSIFVTIWTVDLLVRRFCGFKPETDWAFICDCVVDVIAKMLYSSVIQEKSDAEPILFGQERMQVIDDRMQVVWNDVSDVLIVSQAHNDATLLSFASPSIRSLLGAKHSEEWVVGVVHPRVHRCASATQLSLPCSSGSSSSSQLSMRAAECTHLPCTTLEEVVCYAWEHERFTCSLPSTRSDSDWRVCEVSGSCSEQGCVVVMRDITDRIKRQEAEREVLSQDVARQKDEEANSFTRHEVKNSVLAAITHCDRICEVHREAVHDGAIIDPAYEKSFSTMLKNMRSGLQQTLESVLSHAMAREVIHGLYVVSCEPVRIDEALQISQTAEAESRFPVRRSPPELPVVDIDPRLLLHIYRNAVSNACRYGKKGGLVTTEIDFKDDTLTLRVINLPGAGHEKLMAMRDASVVFNKGTRFHYDDVPAATARTSTGDGAWIMRKCAECMRGTCSIDFTPTRTVFELKCPATARLDESLLEDAHLGQEVWGFGVDDCEFQRFVLNNLFASVGVREEQIYISGEEASDLEYLADNLICFMRKLPPDAVVLAIIDENLDLPQPCQATVSGSYAVKLARERMPEDLERRLLAFVRSANDSANDQQLYAQRAHGFLRKEHGKATHASILRACACRFGTQCLRRAEAVAEQQSADVEQAEEHVVAMTELDKVMATLETWQSMSWNEVWRKLHRMKGIVTSAPVGGAVCNHMICEIESLRCLDALPSNFSLIWANLKALHETYKRLSIETAIDIVSPDKTPVKLCYSDDEATYEREDLTEEEDVTDEETTEEEKKTQ